MFKEQSQFCLWKIMIKILLDSVELIGIEGIIRNLELRDHRCERINQKISFHVMVFTNLRSTLYQP